MGSSTLYLLHSFSHHVISAYARATQHVFSLPNLCSLRNEVVSVSGYSVYCGESDAPEGLRRYTDQRIPQV